MQDGTRLIQEDFIPSDLHLAARIGEMRSLLGRTRYDKVRYRSSAMSLETSSLFSRRSFLQASTLASAALALRIATEPMLAFAAAPQHAADAVMINANENPLGPCPAARDAVLAITPISGRYFMERTNEFSKQYAQSLAVTDEQVSIFAGSTEPLLVHRARVLFAHGQLCDR